MVAVRNETAHLVLFFLPVSVCVCVLRVCKLQHSSSRPLQQQQQQRLIVVDGMAVQVSDSSKYELADNSANSMESSDRVNALVTVSTPITYVHFVVQLTQLNSKT